MRLESKSRGQRRGIFRCDGRTREGRLLKETRKALLDHLGSGATVVQRSMVVYMSRCNPGQHRYKVPRWDGVALHET
jgi:hypothetical protein